jgi:hypothetical protein
MASSTQVRRVLLQIEADEGDSERKLDAITAKAEELGRLHPELQVKIDSAAAAAKMRVLRAELTAAAAEKPIEPKIEPKADEAKAVEAGRSAGRAAGGGFRLGFSPRVAGIGSLVALGLAGLPAAAAAAGALAGAALGAKLLVGTKAVQGPLYKQFHDMTQTLTSVMRVAALPLVQPLGDAFRQIGTWAKQTEPLIRSVFASVGPLIQPLVSGLEQLVTGILPGFVTLMHAAQPAVAAVAGVLRSLGQGAGGLLAGLAPAVRASSVVLSALGSVVRALMPLIDTLSGTLARTLTPILATVASVVRTTVSPMVARLAGLLGQTLQGVLPPLATAISRILPPLVQLATNGIGELAPLIPPVATALARVASVLAGQLADALTRAMPGLTQISNQIEILLASVIIPNLPALTRLATSFIQVQLAITPVLLPALATLTGNILELINKAVAPALPALTNLANALANIASAAANAISWLSRVPGLGHLFSGGSGGFSLAGGGMPESGAHGAEGAAASTAGYSAGLAAGSAYGGAWADGATSAAPKAAKARAAAHKLTAADFALILAGGAGADLTGTAAQVRAGVARLIKAITQDESAGVLSKSQGSDLTLWLDKDSTRLQGLANKRTSVLREIAAAQKYAASVATNIRNQDDLQSAAAGGWNGGPQTTGQIVANLQLDVANIRKFAHNIEKLRKMGLNRTYLAQLIQMGPDAGGQLAEQLANSGLASIRQINSAESQIVQVSGYLGKTAANAMYDTGVNAGKGFLSGLEAQQSSIEKIMQKIAKSMVDTLKRELGIHSPSSVARALARDGWGGGLVMGLEDSHGRVITASSRLSRAMIQPGGSGGAAGRGGGGAAVVTFDFRNMPAPVRTWLKKSIRVNGGDPSVIGA